MGKGEETIKGDTGLFEKKPDVLGPAVIHLSKREYWIYKKRSA